MARRLLGRDSAGNVIDILISAAAVADGSTLPPYIVVHMWKRTA